MEKGTPSATSADSAVPVELKVDAFHLTDERFALLCRENPELRLELTAQRELLILPPTGSKTGLRNGRLTLRLATWAETDGTGLVFDSSTGFTLPNGAKRSPDASWLRRDRWDALTEAQQNGFAAGVPRLRGRITLAARPAVRPARKNAGIRGERHTARLADRPPGTARARLPRQPRRRDSGGPGIARRRGRASPIHPARQRIVVGAARRSSPQAPAEP